MWSGSQGGRVRSNKNNGGGGEIRVFPKKNRRAPDQFQAAFGSWARVWPGNHGSLMKTKKRANPGPFVANGSGVGIGIRCKEMIPSMTCRSSSWSVGRRLLQKLKEAPDTGSNPEKNSSAWVLGRDSPPNVKRLVDRGKTTSPLPCLSEVKKISKEKHPKWKFGKGEKTSALSRRTSTL